MPKEIVQSVCDPYHVKVGWTQDREVQVGVEADGERSLFWMLTGAGYRAETPEPNMELESLGACLRSVIAAHRADSTDAELAADVLNALDVFTTIRYSGVWSTLDRPGINRLIKLLRRARDAAYGRDE